MAATVLDVRNVFKKFKRGELYDSLRDLLPAIARRIARPELKEREFWALRDVSFDVERGEAFGIVGANGAGKSTMLKLLTGIMPPTSGSIHVTGRLSALIEVSAGFHPDLTGRENILLNGTILGLKREQIRQRFDAIVAFSGLESFIDTPVKRYSSGMFARLGFSVAAHVDPDILLVDEVLSVGDYLFQRKCIERMNEVIANGATVVFVSHNLRAVTNLCKRSVFIEKGAVCMLGPTAEVVREYMSHGQEDRAKAERDVMITRVTVHDVAGPRVEFDSDSKLRITVEASARTPHEDMSVVIQVVDDDQYPIFDTCTQRLGRGALLLDSGSTLTCTFEIDLGLAEGGYHVNAFLHRYVTNSPYDRWIGAATFFIAGTPEVRGLLNLHPKLLSCAIEPRAPDSVVGALPPRRNDPE